jgi:hypothetical protein
VSQKERSAGVCVQQLRYHQKDWAGSNWVQANRYVWPVLTTPLQDPSGCRREYPEDVGEGSRDVEAS